MDAALEGVGRRVTTDMNALMRHEYTNSEIIEALQQMHPLKAPGPDGMNALFYQTHWHLVGPKVSDLVLHVLRGGRLPESINRTFIVLIPKKKNPEKVTDFRPISLCNVVYKLISKVLANMLKSFLGDIVSENQSAFTPGRLITDNILVAFEVFHYMKNTRTGKGHMALKLDISKAYDRIEWRFLERVLVSLGFDRRWMSQVMECVKTVSFSVLINGSPTKVFRPNRGLRQGDPLSPYLYILCAEALSGMIRRAVERRAISGVKVARRAPIIFHLLFADDSIIFTTATEREARTVKDILRIYEQASGHTICLEKTRAYFTHCVTQDRKEILANVLGVQVVASQDKYLGLPTTVGISKKSITNILLEKMWKKQQGWKGMTLSKAGREVLIKAVAQSIPTYAMSVFKILASFCDELRKVVSQFWWGHSKDNRKIYWLSWRKLCKPKKLRGIGFRDYRLFNQALLGKQAWRLCIDEESLVSRVFKGKYYPDSTFLKANLGVNPSYTWRSICEARSVVRLGLRKRISDGRRTAIWEEAWIPGNNDGRVITRKPVNCSWFMVKDLIGENNNSWREADVRACFIPFEADRILSIRLSSRRPTDEWYWMAEKDGHFSVKSAYRLLVGAREEENASSSTEDLWLWNGIWRVEALPRIKPFFWQWCREALPTKARLATRIGHGDASCPLCNYMEETDVHLFRDCSWVKGV
ncbi:hypothetical protein vseg_006119 [Gypsophila vaccaria]